MSTFEQMGFLSTDMDSFAKEFAEHFSDWKSLYLEVNEFALAQFHKIRADNKNKRNVLIYASYYRALNIYQSVFLLLERGSENEGKALLRNLIETVFTLRALEQHALFYKLFIKFDQKKQADMYIDAIALHDKKAASGKDSHLTSERADEMRKTVEAYKQSAKLPASPLHIVPKIDKNPNMEKLAELAGMEDEYITEYTYLCKFTHISGFGMESNFIGDAAGKPASFYVGPIVNDAQPNMRTGIKMLLKATAAFADFYKLPIGTEIAALGQKLKTLENIALSLSPSPA